MAKVRVSALAKELGTDSKTLIAHLNSIGEYVKTASSTIEAPVVRKATETFPEDLKKAPAKKAAAKPAGPAAPAAQTSAAPAAPAEAPAAAPAPVA
ncbi:MAG: translation initiation factor IF-2 N-terminal domain-containing protein, partial [Pedococcus sp.]